MEGRGFLEAVHIHSLLGTVVRGISDLLSRKPSIGSIFDNRRPRVPMRRS
jgi:hypothetical protein